MQGSIPNRSRPYHIAQTVASINMTAAEDWQTIAAGKRKSNAAKIPEAWRLPAKTLESIHASPNAHVLDVPRTCGVLTEREIEITEKYDATGLLEKLATGEFSAYDVTLAFCKRAAIAQQLVSLSHVV